MLDELTRQFRERVEGREAFGFDIKFDLGQTGCIHVAGSATPIKISNENAAADTTFIMSAEDLSSLLSGELPPMSAYMQGKMTIEGDLGKAMHVGQLLA